VATPDPALINTGDFFIDPTTTNIDLSDSRKYSFVQRLGTQVRFGYAGGRYLNLSDITGGFVGSEGGKKPVANPTTTKGEIAVREWAVVVPVPKRLYDADPDGAIAMIQQRIPESYARAFDDLATTGAGVSGQSNLSDVTKTITLGTAAASAGGVWTDFNNGLKQLVAAHKRLTGTVLDAVVEPTLNASVDTTGRPTWVDVPVGPDTNGSLRQGRLIGRPAQFVEQLTTDDDSLATAVVGYMGDWSRLVWGTVGGIDYKVSTEGTYTDNDGTVHSALQENLILFRAEALLGIQVADLAAFVKVLAGTAVAS
jgi:HK97 family phage major capsid protein